MNIALCQMKMKEWKKAKSTCSKIIQANADVAKVGRHFNSKSFETLNVNLQDLYLVHLMRTTNFTKHVYLLFEYFLPGKSFECQQLYWHFLIQNFYLVSIFKK